MSGLELMSYGHVLTNNSEETHDCPPSPRGTHNKLLRPEYENLRWLYHSIKVRTL